jgi:hypothetical protein
MTASAVSSQKILDRNKIEMGLHVPADTSANIHSVLSYVDLRDYDSFAVVVEPTTVAANSNGVTLVEIVAATESNGTSATQIKTSGAIALSSTTYYQVLECLAEEIAELGRASSLALRYVGARITCDSANSRAACTYIRGLAKNQHLDLTASKTS